MTKHRLQGIIDQAVSDAPGGGQFPQNHNDIR